MSLLDRFAARLAAADAERGAFPASEGVFTTRALTKFLNTLTARAHPLLLDLGPGVGGNVSFFGGQLGCKIIVEDLFDDVDRHVREGHGDALPEFLGRRFTQGDGTVDGVLCWDVVDHLEGPAARVLAGELRRVLRPDGALLGLFGTARSRDSRYTRYTIVDEVTLRYRSYGAARGRQMPLLNRDIIRLFDGLRVSDSFLLKNELREILFRKPA